MLTPDHPRRRSRGLAAAMVLAAMLLVPASATMAIMTRNSESRRTSAWVGSEFSMRTIMCRPCFS